MEKDIVKELSKNLNWHEKVIIKMFRKLFVVIYRKGMLDLFNWINNGTF